MMERLSTIIKPSPMPEDSRRCVLCHISGDARGDGPGRLLNLDVDKWVHLNCALWSYEVYETLNGALINVEAAFKRGLSLDCTLCRRKGATLGCFKLRCTNVYHVKCAKKDGVMFFQDKVSQHLIFIQDFYYQKIKTSISLKTRPNLHNFY